MQIILMEKVAHLGNLGDVVKVKDGYARNFLIPQGVAKRVTPANLAVFETKRAELEKAQAEKLAGARALAEKIDNNGQPAEVTPADISAMKACVVAKRTHTTPFDLVVSGSSAQLEPSQRQEHMQEWHAAGATWWIEACWGLPEAAAAERISAGPPQII